MRVSRSALHVEPSFRFLLLRVDDLLVLQDCFGQGEARSKYSTSKNIKIFILKKKTLNLATSETTLLLRNAATSKW